MSPANPQPRPALRKAPDGALHPASPQRPPVVVELLPANRKRRKKDAADAATGKAGKASKDSKAGKGKLMEKAKDTKSDPVVETTPEKRVTVTVEMPKSLRKKLRQKAQENGYTAEEAALQLVRAWVED
jgi:hypothetical protein